MSEDDDLGFYESIVADGGDIAELLYDNTGNVGDIGELLHMCNNTMHVVSRSSNLTIPRKLCEIINTNTIN
jgi:hypothetical protein